MKLAQTPDNGPNIQIAALRSLMHETPDIMEASLKLLEQRNTKADVVQLDLNAAGVFRVAAESFAPLPDGQKTGFLKRVTDLHDEAAKESVTNATELTQALAMAQEVLNRKPPQ